MWESNPPKQGQLLSLVLKTRGHTSAHLPPCFKAPEQTRAAENKCGNENKRGNIENKCGNVAIIAYTGVGIQLYPSIVSEEGGR